MYWLKMYPILMEMSAANTKYAGLGCIHCTFQNVQPRSALEVHVSKFYMREMIEKYITSADFLESSRTNKKDVRTLKNI